MPPRDRRLLLAVAVAALATAPYLNSLRNGFLYDDVPLVAENVRLRSAAGVASIATTDWWGGTRPMSRLYRPLTMATFALDAAIAKSLAGTPVPRRLPDAAAVPFHVQNVAWHAAASALFFLLLLELFQSVTLAGIAAALFAVHPVHTEAVDGIVGRAELMAACFSFGALLAARKGRPLLFGLALLLALLSKEQAIVIPVFALAWPSFVEEPSRRRVAAAAGAAVLAYLAVRTAVLGSVTGAAATAAGALNVDNPLAGASVLDRVMTAVRVFGEVVRLLVFPKRLSADYSFDQIPVLHAPDPATLLAGVCLLLLGALAVRGRKRFPAASFGSALLLVSWVLTSNLVLTIGTILGERLLYMPSAGACLVLAAAIVALTLKRAPWLAAGVLVLAFGMRTWDRNRDWKDNATLFSRTAMTSSRSCKAANANASELLAKGRLPEARAEAERSLSIFPGYAEAHATLAKVARAQGQAAEAMEHARAAIAADASRADSWNTLGALALDAGDVDGAERGYREALARDRSYVPALNGMGVVLSQRAEREPDDAKRHELLGQALAQFQHALALDPSDPQAASNAATAKALVSEDSPSDPAAGAIAHGAAGERFLAQGRLDEALAEFREAARLEPAGARSYLGIGSAFAAKAEASKNPAFLDEAASAFARAVELEPQNPTAHMNLGVALIRLRRDPARVAAEFKEYLRLVPDAPQRAQMQQTIREMEALAARGPK
jgi:tetratricopeptide (TPR) repeat protein